MTTSSSNLLSDLLNLGPIGCLFLLISIIIGIISLIILLMSSPKKRTSGRIGVFSSAIFVLASGLLASTCIKMDIFANMAHYGALDPDDLFKNLIFMLKGLKFFLWFAAILIFILILDLISRKSGS